MSGSAVTLLPDAVRESWRSKTRTVLSRTSFLHNSPEMSDVQFIFKKKDDNEETTIYGHKFILAMASPVFNKIFFGQNPQFTITEDLSRMDMSHHPFTAEAFLTFIKFLYTDKINYEAYEGLSTEILVGVLNCADYYDVPYLKSDCVKQLGKIISRANVLQVFESGLLFRERDLAVNALQFIYQNPKFVFESEEILCVKKETLLQILKRDSLDIDEHFVLDLAVKWPEQECNRKDLTPTWENKRKVLGEVFFQIRFALLASDRISELVSSGFLTPKESVDMLLAVHRQPTTGAFGPVFKIICPEVAFKSDPRVFGQKLELSEKKQMESRWKERNKLEYWKSLARVQANLCMRGFPRGETEEDLQYEIDQTGIATDLHTKKIRGARGAFHVRFLYNPSEMQETDLWNPVYYGLPDTIEISNWVEP